MDGVALLTALAVRHMLWASRVEAIPVPLRAV
jgi:hypothetical protein